MIIPVKCFTCGNVLANKYITFINQVAAEKEVNKLDNDIKYLDTSKKIDKTIEGKKLDQLNIKNMCCRRHMLTHVDIF